MSLPSSTGPDSYSTLVQNYVGREENNTPQNADTSLLLNQLGFTRPGFYNYNNGGLDNQSSSGYYWSHTPHGVTDAYTLSFRFARLNPRNNYTRGDGFSLRCLAR